MPRKRKPSRDYRRRIRAPPPRMIAVYGICREASPLKKAVIRTADGRVKLVKAIRGRPHPPKICKVRVLGSKLRALQSRGPCFNLGTKEAVHYCLCREVH